MCQPHFTQAIRPTHFTHGEGGEGGKNAPYLTLKSNAKVTPHLEGWLVFANFFRILGFEWMTFHSNVRAIFLKNNVISGSNFAHWFAF